MARFLCVNLSLQKSWQLAFQLSWQWQMVAIFICVTVTIIHKVVFLNEIILSRVVYAYSFSKVLIFYCEKRME